MTQNADSGRVIDGVSMTPEQQADYWQERYFMLLDDHAALINQLQAIRRVLDEPLPHIGSSAGGGEDAR